jgi:ribonuclease Z
MKGTLAIDKAGKRRRGSRCSRALHISYAKVDPSMPPENSPTSGASLTDRSAFGSQVPATASQDDAGALTIAHQTTLTFLGTGNFSAPARYWNSFLIGERVLVEPSPAVLPNLRKLGKNPRDIDVIFISHFHADHTFGWPFLLLSYLSWDRRASDLWVVGPPGIKDFLENMTRAGAIDHIVSAGFAAPGGGFPLRYIEVTGEEQEAGPVRFRAVRVEHDTTLDCYGYLIRDGERTIGYSGDSRLCDGLREIAAGADTLVLACNQRHEVTPFHMNLDDVRTLRAEYPAVPFVLTHRGPDVDGDGIADVTVPDDFETVIV